MTIVLRTRQRTDLLKMRCGREARPKSLILRRSTRQVRVTEALSPNTLRAAPLARSTLTAFSDAAATTWDWHAVGTGDASESAVGS